MHDPSQPRRPRSSDEVAFANPASVQVREAMEQSRGVECDIRGFFRYFDATFGWGEDVRDRQGARDALKAGPFREFWKDCLRFW